MDLSYNWLNKYVKIDDLSPEAIQAYLTNAGLEVEGYRKLASGSNLTVGQVLEVQDHPESDHLKVCQVQTQDATLQIVCGAPNVATSQKVIVALVGAELPDIKIKETTIRGVKSSGMICSLSELGVDKKLQSEEQLAGIEVLDNKIEVGSNPLQVLGLDDVIFDVALTPNRSDCLAYWSCAKEMGAVLKRTVTLPEVKLHDTSYLKTNLKISSDSANCQKFIGQIVGEVQVKESPVWLKQALAAVGIKSINNVVDISNYVMVETGQPLHFYDIKKLKSLDISVTDQDEGGYTALDGVTYQVIPGDLMIKSGTYDIGIAGVMGGDDSKIDETTTGIMIEAAIFNPVSIRKTARRLGLATEASSRFQKGLDPLAPEKAVARSVSLLKELANAKLIEVPYIYDETNYQAVTISISLKAINQRLGTNFTLEAVAEVFKSLDFSFTINNEEFQVIIPSYRTDLKAPVDLTEEVIRLIGYDQITSTLPLGDVTIGGYLKAGILNNKVKTLMSGLGFQEVIGYSLISKKQLNDTLMALDDPVVLANPISEERTIYRNSLAPSLLEVMAYNKARYQAEWAVFELGNVASNSSEPTRLSFSISHEVTVNLWQNRAYQADFYYGKGLILTLLTKLGYDVKRISFEADSKETLLHPYQQAMIYLDKTKIGVFGMIHPLVVKRYDLEPALLAEIDLSTLNNIQVNRLTQPAFSRYPSVSYDISIVVKETVSAKMLLDTVYKAGGKLVSHVEIFDVYQGERIESGSKSIALTVVYQALDKTLSEKEVLPLQNKIVEALIKEHNAIYRDK